MSSKRAFKFDPVYQQDFFPGVNPTMIPKLFDDPEKISDEDLEQLDEEATDEDLGVDDEEIDEDDLEGLDEEADELEEFDDDDFEDEDDDEHGD